MMWETPTRTGSTARTTIGRDFDESSSANLCGRVGWLGRRWFGARVRLLRGEVTRSLGYDETREENRRKSKFTAVLFAFLLVRFGQRFSGARASKPVAR